MMENLRKALLMGTGYTLLSMVALAADDNGSDEIDLLELDVSLDEVEKPEEIQPGVYEAEIQDVQKQTSSRGNQYYAVRFVIPPENIPNDLREDFPDGCSLYWNRQVVPKAGDRRALHNLRRFMEALGLPTNVNQINPNDWMGQRARIRVRMGKWEGQDRAEIQSIEAGESEVRSASRSRPQAVEPKAAPKRAAARGRGR